MWRRLLRGHIIGIVDAHGVVHSEFTGTEIKQHDLFPTAQCRWRWNHDKSIHWFMLECRPTEPQYDDIQAHLTKKYGLRWWKNGHHDIDHLLAKCEEEEKLPAPVSEAVE